MEQSRRCRSGFTPRTLDRDVHGRGVKPLLQLSARRQFKPEDAAGGRGEVGADHAGL